MIKPGSILRVADTYGAQTVKLICIYRHSFKSLIPGTLILVSIRSYIPNTKVKKGELYKAIIVQIKTIMYRLSGVYVKGKGNRVVILEKKYRQKGHTSWKDPKEPYAIRLLGSIAVEVRYAGYFKVISMAPRVY